MAYRTLRDIMDNTSFFYIQMQDEIHESNVVGNLTKIEGHLLEVMKEESPIVALSNVRENIYQGN